MKWLRRFPYLSEDYDKNQAVWNIPFQEELLANRKRMILISLCIPIFIGMFFFVHDSYQGEGAMPLRSLVIAAVLSVLLVVYLRTKRTDLFSILIPLIMLSGILAALILPGTGGVFFLFSYYYPILVFQLWGTRKGTLWTVGGLAVFLLVEILGALKLIELEPYHLQSGQAFFMFSGWLLMVLTQYYTSWKNESYTYSLQTRIIYDSITGLPNKEILFGSVNPYKSYLFIITSIENYQDLHNLFGYEMCDNILIHIKVLIEQLIEKMELYPFKLKGSEFGLLVPILPDSKPNELILKKIHAHLTGSELIWKQTNIQMHIRLGAVEINPYQQNSFLSQADLALEKARHSFRQIHIFNEADEVPQKSYDKIKNFSILQKNIRESLLQVYYQPIVSAQTGEVCWKEALMRFQSPEGKVLPPLPFIQLAEQTGTGTIISKSLIKLLARDQRRSPGSISLNITHRDLMDQEFLLLVESFLEAAADGQRIIFEILESQDLLNNQAFLQFAKNIHKKNGLIALDDFGSGYSNFVNFFKIPFDIIKFDGALIQQINKNPESRQLISGVVRFCKERGLETMAEYVETKENAEILTQMGLDYLQGYLFGKPCVL